MLYYHLTHVRYLLTLARCCEDARFIQHDLCPLVEQFLCNVTAIEPGFCKIKAMQENSTISARALRGMMAPAHPLGFPPPYSCPGPHCSPLRPRFSPCPGDAAAGPVSSSPEPCPARPVPREMPHAWGWGCPRPPEGCQPTLHPANLPCYDYPKRQICLREVFTIPSLSETSYCIMP